VVYDVHGMVISVVIFLSCRHSSVLHLV